MDTATSAGPSRRTFLSAAIAAASAGAATPLIGTALTSPAHAEVKPPALPPPATAQVPDAELRALLGQVGLGVDVQVVDRPQPALAGQHRCEVGHRSSLRSGRRPRRSRTAGRNRSVRRPA